MTEALPACTVPSQTPERQHAVSPSPRPASAVGQSHFGALATPYDVSVRGNYGRRGGGRARTAGGPGAGGVRAALGEISIRLAGGHAGWLCALGFPYQSLFPEFAG